MKQILNMYLSEYILCKGVFFYGIEYNITWVHYLEGNEKKFRGKNTEEKH